MNEYVKRLENGCVVRPDAAEAARMDEKEWNPHPAFKGVALRHLLCGAETGGTMSLHQVRVDPGCVIGSHVHEYSWELHQVVGGGGECIACEERIAYAPGVQAALPSAVAHEVRAGEEGLMLIATFSPPLL